MHECVLSGTPYPVQIISPRHGKDAYSYSLIWANPKTGGKPIEKYIIRYRKVTNAFSVSVPAFWNPLSFNCRSCKLFSTC